MKESCKQSWGCNYTLKRWPREQCKQRQGSVYLNELPQKWSFVTFCLSCYALGVSLPGCGVFPCSRTCATLTFIFFFLVAFTNISCLWKQPGPLACSWLPLPASSSGAECSDVKPPLPPPGWQPATPLGSAHNGSWPAPWLSGNVILMH